MPQRKINKTITICSSASFYKEVLDIAEKLQLMGFNVKLPRTAGIMKKSGDFNIDTYKTWFKNEKDYKKKKALMDEHFVKVIESDAILVVNNSKKGIKGYIGGNVLMEMVIAYHYKKPIYVWNKIDNKNPFEEEIKAMKTIFLNQNLADIRIRD